MKVAVEHQFSGLTANLGVTYDSSKTMLGSLLRQYTGPTPQDKYVTPIEAGIVNIPEIANTSYGLPHVYQWSPNIFWIFMAQNTSASVTRTVGLFEFDSLQSTITFKGFVIVGDGVRIPGNKTIRSLCGMVSKHIDGTVGVTATGVCGSGTYFVRDGIASANGPTGGARIGFGSTYPPNITQWYEISSIQSDTSLLLKNPVTSNIPTGTPYVIEEVRLAIAMQNASTTAGGVYLLKGLNYSTFELAGVTCPEAFATDNIYATYVVREQVHTGTTGWGMQNLIGLGITDMAGPTLHTFYALNTSTPDTSTQVRIFNLNLRAPLINLASAGTTSAVVYKTGVATITGTPTTVGNNGRVFTVNHLAAAGITSFWFGTTTRLYRCALSAITQNSTSFLSDFMVELPPGGSNITYSSTSQMTVIDYSSTIDRILIPTASGRFGTYIGRYDSGSTTTFEKLFGTNLNRYKIGSTPSGTVNGVFPQTTITIWTQGGFAFLCPSTTTSGLNWLMAMPIGADGFYSSNTNQRIITPKLTTTNATRLYRVYVESAEYLGSYPLGFPAESYRVYYRLNGIDDNSGSWTEVPLSGDLTGIAPGSYIQFMIELDVLGEICAPNRIYNLVCVYEDGSQDSHYQPSLSKSSATNRQFAWKQVELWNSNIPNLQLRLYNADTGFLVLDDNVTSSTSGTFEYSNDGGSGWTAWNNSADALGNYIRYTADSLPNNITVRALLTQA
jgi:hypothetical protein